MRVVLQRAGQERAHERDHFLVVTVRRSRRHGRVVLVDQHDDILLVVAVERIHEELQRIFKQGGIGPSLTDVDIILAFLAGGKRLHARDVPLELVADVDRKRPVGFFPPERLVVLEGEVDDGVLPLLGHPFVRVLAVRDRARLEEVTHVRLVRAALLEEALEHLHRSRLAEAARAREQRRPRARRKEVADEEGLIDAIAMLGYFLPETLADRERKQPAP